MGGNDFCAVYGCSNCRSNKDKLIVKDHVGILRWHSPKTKADMRIWGKMMQRGGNFKISMSTKVCSNHFTAGYCSDVCRIPTLYMKGYDQQLPKERQGAVKRSSSIDFETPVKKRSRHVTRKSTDEPQNDILFSPTPKDHDYEISEVDMTSPHSRTVAFVQCRGLSDVKENDDLFKFYTGLPNYTVFKWLYDKIQFKAKNLQYYRGVGSFQPKRHQVLKKKKSGKSRQMTIENELFMTLYITGGYITDIGNLDVLRSYPKCFQSFSNIVGIIDCTEGIIEKPSIAKGQSQTYSSYKSRNTWKKLLCITHAGTISYISKSYGGSASDRFIVETSGMLDKLDYGDNIMADKGFNISDLLISRGSKLIILPFLRDKGKFSKRNCSKTSQIAKARIHVERAIARIKDFRIIQGALPLTLKDQLDNIFVICSAITNLGPALLKIRFA
ncbi:uncharacterized protein LOC130648051 [Hydractinia symbiolongicarpus]|uniref:uncharacterized protein LOC130648051 n=1 Tax=Hydractinia symbiolongicarpus TaxID=13093 RepID=UPI00254D30D6|nr:uncharacterized protein LOC130648051 [Hydractinia symbiolongicarpus]